MNVNIEKKPRPRSRFELYVRLHENQKFRFYGDKLDWTLRGDCKKGNESPEKQLRYLLNNIKRRFESYLSIELYDTSLPKQDGERLVLKILHGDVKVNGLHWYQDLLKDYALPTLLKPKK